MNVVTYRVTRGGCVTGWRATLCRRHAAQRNDLADVSHSLHDGLCDACDDERAERERDACERASLYQMAPFED